MKRNIWLYLDDIRIPNTEEIIKSYPNIQAIALFRNCEQIINYLDKAFELSIAECDNIYIDFDNDLGEELEGYDVAKYIVEHNYPIKGFHIHSMNPIGIKNIRELLVHYGYEEI